MPNLNDYMHRYFSTFPFETTEQGDVGVPIFLQDQTTPIIQVRMLRRLGTFTLASDAVRDTYTFTASPSHGLVIGDFIELADATHFIQATVLNVVGDVITLDGLINKAYTASSTTGIRSTDTLVVDGSVAPVIFSIKPEPTQAGDITNVILTFRSNLAMDFSNFGAGLALTRGCLLRKKNADGNYTNLMNFKTNGEFIAQAFASYFQEKAGGGDYGFAGELKIAGQDNFGVSVRLDGALGEELQLVVQDNLTTRNLTNMRVFAIGSELQD